MIERAISPRNPGPYQLQAAIGALHVDARTPEETDWEQIADLYAALARMNASPTVALNRAVAVAMAEGPERGLELIDAIDLPGYHLLPASRADLLRRLDRPGEAALAYTEALELEMNGPDRAYLEGRLDEVTAGR